MSLKQKVKSLLWDYILSDIRDGLATQRLIPLTEAYLPWSPSALSATVVEKLLNEIIVNQRSSIVECGGGMSTIYIARLLQQRADGHLHTIEHDGEWLTLLKDLLDERGLDEHVSLIHAPLQPTEQAWSGEQWYSVEIVRNALKSVTIDLVLVDGPPAYRPEISHSRYPAVPILSEFLMDQYTIVLDDIDREGEKEIIKEWECQLGIDFDICLLDGNFAIGTKGEAFTV